MVGDAAKVKVMTLVNGAEVPLASVTQKVMVRGLSLGLVLVSW